MHASRGMDEKMIHCLPKNEWNCKPNPNSLPNTSQWLLSLLLMASQFSVFLWLLIFWWLRHCLLWHCHLQHVYSFPPLLLHSTRFIQCWSLCHLHGTLAIFAQLFVFIFILRSFCEINVMLPSIQLPSLIAPSSIHLATIQIYDITKYIEFMTKLGVFHTM
jgi:hypothetical protein